MPALTNARQGNCLTGALVLMWRLRSLHLRIKRVDGWPHLYVLDHRGRAWHFRYVADVAGWSWPWHHLWFWGKYARMR